MLLQRGKTDTEARRKLVRDSVWILSRPAGRERGKGRASDLKTRYGKLIRPSRFPSPPPPPPGGGGGYRTVSCISKRSLHYSAPRICEKPPVYQPLRKR